MPRVCKVLMFLVVAAAGVPAPGVGQWLRYPTADVPRNADGSPNLTAPAPRLANGKPDLSGIWHAAVKIPCTSDLGRFIPCGAEIGGSPLARNLGLNLPGGLPYQPWAAEVTRQRTASQSLDDPHVRCLPDNPPRTWTMPHLTKVVHTPKLLVLLYEVNAMYRQIFIDGRPFPEDMNPTWNGYSVGRWEGDTLVVETRGFRDAMWIDMSGSPMGESATMTERLRRTNYGTLDVEITVDDPKVYTRPWTISLTQALELDTELADEFCLENEKSWAHMQAAQAKEKK